MAANTMATDETGTTQYVININYPVDVERVVWQQHGMGPPPPPPSHRMSDRSKRDFVKWIDTGDEQALADVFDEWNRFPDIKIFSIPGTGGGRMMRLSQDDPNFSRIEALRDHMRRPSHPWARFTCKLRATWKGPDRISPVKQRNMREYPGDETVLQALRKFEYGVDYHFDLIQVEEGRHGYPVLGALPACTEESRLRLSGEHHFLQDNIFSWDRFTFNISDVTIRDRGPGFDRREEWTQYQWDTQVFLLVPRPQVWGFLRSSLRTSRIGDPSIPTAVMEMLSHHMSLPDENHHKHAPVCYEAIEFAASAAEKALEKEIVMSGALMNRIFDFTRCNMDTILFQKICAWSSQWKIPISMDLFVDLPDLYLHGQLEWCHSILPQCITTLLKVLPTTSQRLRAVNYIPAELREHIRIQTRETPLTLCLNCELDDLGPYQLACLVRSKDDGWSLIRAAALHGTGSWLEAALVPLVLQSIRTSKGQDLWKWIGFFNMFGRNFEENGDAEDRLPITPSFARQTFLAALTLFAQNGKLVDISTVYTTFNRGVAPRDASEFIAYAAEFDKGSFLRRMLAPPETSSINLRRPTTDEYRCLWVPIFRDLATEAGTPYFPVLLEVFISITEEYIRIWAAAKSDSGTQSLWATVDDLQLREMLALLSFEGQTVTFRLPRDDWRIVYRHLKKDPSLQLFNFDRLADPPTVKARVPKEYDPAYRPGELLYLVEIERMVRQDILKRGGPWYTSLVNHLSYEQRRSLARLEFLDHPGMRKVAEVEREVIRKIQRVIDQSEKSETEKLRGTKRSAEEFEDQQPSTRVRTQE